MLQMMWSPDARNWHYIKPLTPFVPRGDLATGVFDCWYLSGEYLYMTKAKATICT